MGDEVESSGSELDSSVSVRRASGTTRFWLVKLDKAESTHREFGHVGRTPRSVRDT